MRPTPPCQLRQLRIRKTVWRIPHSQPSPRTTAAPEQTPLRAAYYRGGTSRAVILEPQHLPSNHAQWRGLFRQTLGNVGLGQAYGRQLRRLEKGPSSLGKICLVEPYRKTKEEDVTAHHIDYTLVNVDTKSGFLDVAGNSGNMLSAIGPYAYNARLLPPDLYAVKDGEITVIIRNTNTMKLVESTFYVSGGQAAVTGNHTVDGVNGKGSRVSLAFQDTTRSTTGKTFPTGKTVDVIEGCKVTCVDGAVPVVFIRADAVGVPGTILPYEFDAHKDKLDLLEKIRRAAAVAMGIATTEKAVPRTIPTIAIVSQSSHHTTVTDATLKASQTDIVVRFISDSQPHQAVPLTGALTTAVAARMPGTVVEQLLAPDEAVTGAVTIGHPSGRLHVNINYDTHEKTWVAGVSTTAQRLFEGKVFWTESSTETKTAIASDANTMRHALGLAFVNELRLRESPMSLVEGVRSTSGEIASQAEQKAKSSPPPPPTSPQPDLQLPTPSTKRDEAHLLRELSILRNSLTHFTKLYPSPESPEANTPKVRSSEGQPPKPTPSIISHHLSSITQHINILTASLAPISRPKRAGVPNRKKGDQWHHWAKTFSRWDKIRLVRESEKKRVKKEERKSSWARWRDRGLNALNKRGTPVAMGRWRKKLLESREGKGRDVEWPGFSQEMLGRDSRSTGRAVGGKGSKDADGKDKKGTKKNEKEGVDAEKPDAIDIKADFNANPLRTNNLDAKETANLDVKQDATSAEIPYTLSQFSRVAKWHSFKDVLNRHKDAEKKS